jgi:hypothetical protein
MMQITSNKLRAILVATFVVMAPLWSVQSLGAAPRSEELIKELQKNAKEFLEKLDVSYAMGGNRVGNEAECENCNQCLMDKSPKPKERMAVCPSCQQCSLDCSHFTHLLMNTSGIKIPYLTTDTMNQSSKLDLLRKYGLIDVGTVVEETRPGDLLVYRGHVVMLLEKTSSSVGTVIHATGGKDIKLPGQGIQLERQAQLLSFRGPLLRILRAKSLTALPQIPRVTNSNK